MAKSRKSHESGNKKFFDGKKSNKLNIPYSKDKHRRDWAVSDED